jgi:micrococcal nuclease
LGGSFFQAKQLWASINTTVSHVINGDTLQLSNGEIVRLIGMDCEENEYRPEEAVYIQSGKKFKHGPDSEKRAKQAAEFVRRLAEGKEIRLEYDEKQFQMKGRTLAYAYLDFNGLKGLKEMDRLTEIAGRDCPECESNLETYCSATPLPEQGGQCTVFLNATIIKAGYAQALIISPNVKYQALFVKLENQAKRHKRGVWK